MLATLARLKGNPPFRKVNVHAGDKEVLVFTLKSHYLKTKRAGQLRLH